MRRSNLSSIAKNLLSALCVFLCMSGCGSPSSQRGDLYVRDSVPSGSAGYSRYATNIEELSKGWTEEETVVYDGKRIMKDSFIIIAKSGVTGINRTGAEPAGKISGDSVSRIASASGYEDSQFSQVITPVPGVTILRVEISADKNIILEMAKFGQMDSVETAIPNYIIERPDGEWIAPAGSLDSAASNWALERISLPGYEEKADIFSRLVKVAVIDTGMDIYHPALSGILDSRVKSSEMKDIGWHGTAMAGIIAAAGKDRAGNILVTRGVAEGRVRVIPIIACNNILQCPMAEIINSVGIAMEMGADIISLNVCADAGIPLLEDIMEAAGAGSLVVAPACNRNDDASNYLPANSRHTLTVGAVTEENTRASEAQWGSGKGSGYGARVDISAPGHNVISTFNTRYPYGGIPATQYVSAFGTSFAASYVSGLAALLMSVDESATPADIRNLITETADYVETDRLLGAGIINVERAFDAIYGRASSPAGLEVTCGDDILSIGNTTQCAAVVSDQFGEQLNAGVSCVVSGLLGSISQDHIFKAMEEGVETIVCASGGLSDSFTIKIVAIRCSNASDCDDGDILTIDSCMESGTTSSYCVNAPCEQACASDADCDDGIVLTSDTCELAGTCIAYCGNIPCTAACAADIDCDDSDAMTIDSCSNPNTCGAACDYLTMACLSDSDCDDGSVITLDTCANPGQIAAVCLNTPLCDPVCSEDADCADTDPYTLDICGSPYTCEAACENIPIACLSDADCADMNPDNRDFCHAPGTAGSACAHADVPLRVAAGYEHTCAVYKDATLKCWGSNTYGAFGNGTTVSSPLPVKIDGISGAVDVSAGYRHTCVLMENGTVKCMGWNESSSVGAPIGSYILTPFQVEGITDAVLLSTHPHGNHNCVVLSSGEVKCWGEINRGEFGIGTVYARLPVPVLVPGASDTVSISAGSWTTCMMTSGGTAKCSGENIYGALGASTTNDSSFFIDVTVSQNIKRIETSGRFSCAILNSGTVDCWGKNDFGQLGDGTKTDSLAARPVQGIDMAEQIFLAPYHSCALTTTGGIKCWGRNIRGQLGAGYASEFEAGVSVVDIGEASDIAVAYEHTCAVTTDGEIKCWGLNYSGQLGVGEEWRMSDTFTPVPVFVNYCFTDSDCDDLDAGTSDECIIAENAGAYCIHRN